MTTEKGYPRPRGEGCCRKAAISIGLGFLLCLPALGQVNPGSWPVFQGNGARSGRGLGSGPQVPETQWTLQLSAGVKTQAVIADDQTIYVTAENGIVQAVNPDGSLKWTFDTAIPWQFRFNSPAVDSSGTIYVPTETGSYTQSTPGYLYALNPDGSLKWRRQTSATDSQTVGYTSVAIGTDGTIYSVNVADGKLEAINAADGSLKFERALPGMSASYGLALGSDGTIYVPTAPAGDDKRLVAIWPDGTVRWSLSLPIGDGFGQPTIPAIDPISGRILIGAEVFLAAVDPAGTFAWIFDTRSVVGGNYSSIVVPPVIAGDGSVRFADQQNLFAVNSDGSLRWRVAERFSPNMLVLDSADSVYGYSTSRSALAVYDSAGTLKWTFAGGSAGGVSIRSDGVLFMGASSNRLLAVREGAPAVPATVSVTASPQTVTATLPAEVAAWVKDAGGAPISGVEVVFALVSGDGALSQTTSVTDGQGVARTTFIGNSSGDSEVRATAGAVSGQVTITTILKALADSPWPGFNHDGGRSGRAAGVGPASPSLQWATSMGGITSQPIIGGDGTTYVSVVGGSFKAVDSAGVVKWSFDTGIQGLSTLNAAAISAQGVIFVPTQAGSSAGPSPAYLYALNPDGTQRWRRQTAGTGSGVSGFTAPDIAPDGTVYSVNALDGKMVAFNPDDGSTKFELSLPGIGSALAFSRGPDGVLYVVGNLGATDRRLFAVTPTGGQRWSLALPTAEGGTVSPPVVDWRNGKIYVGVGSQVVAVEAGGSTVWTFDLRSTGEVDSTISLPPIIAPDGSVRVADQRNLYAISADGALIWRVEAQLSPRLLVLDADGNVYGYDTGHRGMTSYGPTGARRWTFAGGSNAGASIAPDGALYMSDESGRLQAVRHGPAALPASVSLSASPATQAAGIPVDITAVVRDAAGDLIADVPVSFSIVSGQGSLSRASAVTDGRGIGSTTFTGSITEDCVVEAAAGGATGTTVIRTVLKALAASAWPTFQGTGERWGRASTSGPGIPIQFWATQLSGALNSQVVIGPQDVAYAMTSGGILHAVNSDGSSRWTFDSQTPGQDRMSASAISADGVLFVPTLVGGAGGRGHLFALSAADGTMKWDVQTSGTGQSVAGFSSPAIGPDGTVFVSDVLDGKVMALDPETGASRWELPLPGLTGGLARSPGGNLYLSRNLGEAQRSLVVVQANGTILWSRDLPSAAGFLGNPSPPAVTPDGSAFVGNGPFLVSFAASGDLAWVFDARLHGGGLSSIILPPLVATDGSLRFGDSESVYSISAGGQLLWRRAAAVFPNLWTLDSANNLYGFDGSVGSFGSVDAAGVQRWVYPAGTSGGASLRSDGTLYLGDSANRLLAVGQAAVATSADGSMSVTSNVQALEVDKASPSQGAELPTAVATFRSQALAPVGDVYSVEPSVSFDPPAKLTLSFDPSRISDPSTLALYRFDGTSWTGIEPSGIVSSTIDPIAGTVTAYLAHSSLYGLFVDDRLPPRTSLVPGPARFGSDPIWLNAGTSLMLQAVDDAVSLGDSAGAGVATTYLSVDGGDFLPSTGAFVVPTPGPHQLRYYSVDFGGTAESVLSSAIEVDNLPPSLAVNFVPGGVTESTGPLVLSFSDQGVGIDVLSVRLRVDGNELAALSVSASEARYSLEGLPDGTHAFSATVRDRVENEGRLDFSLATAWGASQNASPRAFSRAPDGSLWIAALNYQNDAPVNPRVEKRDAAGALLSSIALPGGNDSGEWGFVFNADGTAWLAGTTEMGAGPRVTLWKVAAAGDALLDTRVLDSAAPAIPGGLARDASGFLWVSGVEISGENLLRFALWKLDASGSLESGFPVTRERGGGADGGLAVAAAPDGSVWAAGVSSDPATGLLDLGLWRYANGILTEHHRPSGFLDLKASAAALAARPDGSLWVAAAKSYPTCPGTDMALLRLDLSGAVASSSYWHAEPSAASFAGALSFDATGGVWVAGKTGGDAALWRFDASGSLSSGYPKGSASPFDPLLLTLDDQNRPWVISGTQPRLFDAAAPLAGNPGPGACAFPPGTLAGSVAGAFADGAPVTVAVVADPFSHDTVAMQTFAASGGSIVYSFQLPGGTSYYVLAFQGDNPEAITATTPIGSYAHWAPAFVPSGGTADADFALAADAEAPTSRITSIADGGSVGVLSTIEGTAADGTAAEFGELAFKDEIAGLWWDRSSQSWVSAPEALYFQVDGQPFSGTPASFSWRVQAQQELGGLPEHLSMNRQYRIYARATDFSRNVEAVPTSALFTWTAPSPVVPPQDVAGTAVTADAVSWTWSLVDGATGYAVYSYSGERLATVAAPPFLQEGLGPDAMSRVCVAASGGLGDSGSACGDPATTWALAPGAPAPQRAEPERLEWLWDTAGNPSYTGYELQLSSDGFTQSSATFFTGSLAAGTSFIAGGLESDRVYAARVRALNGAGLPTAWSASASTRTLQAPPGAPTALLAVFDAAARVIRFSWTPGTGTAASYMLYEGPTANPETFLPVLSDVAELSAELPVFQSGSRYYVVSARNADLLEGARSEAVSVLVDLDPPSAVADLRVWTREEPGQADLFWTAPSDALTGVARYEIRTATWPLSPADFAEGVEVPQSLIPKAGGAAESLVVAVPAGETRYYALRAFDGAGNASVSNAAVYDAVPPVITGLNLEPDSLLSRPRRVAVSATDDATVVTFHFFVDGQPRGTLAGPWAEFFWDTRLEPDGPHLFDVLARDAGGNEAYASRPVMLSYAAPSAPSISMPGDGFVTKVATLAVSGWADPDAAGVQLQVDGLDLATATIVNGAWSIDPATLPSEGDVRLTAIAFESRGFSGPSYPVLVHYGSSAPPVPVELAAVQGTDGAIKLSWKAGFGKAASFYRLYRSLDDTALVEPSPALLLADEVRVLSFTDRPAEDGLYFYAVTAVDGAGNESALSALTYALTDRVAPSGALTLPEAPVGPGEHVVTLTLSEPLQAPPLLTFTAAGAQPIPLDLAGETATVWRATLTVTGDTSPGEAAFAFEGKDLAGNVGRALSNAALLLDTRGPVGTLTLSKPSPVGPGSLELSLSLDEPAAAAPEVLLKGSPVPLTGGGAAWSGSVTIDGATGDGEAILSYSAVDVLGNPGSLLLGTTSFVVDTVAPGAPQAVRANEAAGGLILLSWSPPSGPRPDVYYVYRDGVRISTSVAPAADGTGAYQDRPAEGLHQYEVSSADLAGNESERSDPPATADATPPAAPTGLAVGVNAFGQLEVTWTTGEPDAAKYRLYRATHVILAPSLELLRSGSALSPFLDSPDADGTYHYAVTALDLPGNESALSAEASILFDKAAPVISISGVSDGDFMHGPVVVGFSASDANLASVSATLDGEPFAAGTSVSAEGPHTLVVSAEDSEGHASQAEATFTLDSTPPALDFSGVAEGVVLRSEAAVTVSFSELNLASTAYTLLNETLGVSAPYHSGALIERDGSYRLTATATDKAGNEVTRTLSFRLDVAPVAPLHLRVVLGSGASLTWDQPEPDVLAYRVYRDGVRVSPSLHAPRSFDDPGITAGWGGVYEVSAVDATGQEGPKARATVPAATLSLPATTLTRGFFDAIRPAVGNLSGSPLSVGPALMEVLSSGVVVASATAEAIEVSAGGSGDLQGVIATPLDLPAWPSVRLTVPLPTDAGAEVVLLKTAQVLAADPRQPILEVFPDALVPGTASPVQVKLYNRGTAPMDVVTAQVVNSTYAAVEDVSVRLLTPEGTLFAWGGLKQVAGGAQSAFVGGRQVFFVTVPPGSSVVFDPVRVVVPNTAVSSLSVDARVSTPTYRLPFERLAGRRGFVGTAGQTIIGNVAYRATAAPERGVYDQGEVVRILGESRDEAGAPVAFATVSVHVTNAGFDRHISTVADEAGRFMALFYPAPNEAGVYGVFASHPQVVTHAMESSFSIVGLGFNYRDFLATLAQNSSLDLTVELQNTGETAVEGISATSTLVSGSGVSLTAVGLPSRLEAGQKAQFTLKVAATPQAVSSSMTLTVSESHGFTRHLPVAAQVVPAQAIPSADPQMFELGMLAGETRTRVITLKNQGFETWRGVRLSAPTLLWVKVQGLPEMGDIPPGGNASFTLSFEPASTLPSSTYAQNPLIEVYSVNADTLPINVGVVITTFKQGTIAFNIVNADKPRGTNGQGVPVGGAQVSLTSQDVPGLNYTAVGDANGISRMENIPAGSYAWTVKAQGFQPKSGTVVVEPGISRVLEALLVTATVTYEWSVTPTTIEDVYDVTLATTFKTDVPAPVIVMDPVAITLTQDSGIETMGQFTVTNKGLVSAFDVALQVDSPDGEVTMVLAVKTIPELKPQQTVVVPYTIRHGHGPTPIPGAILPAHCHPLKLRGECMYFCAAGDKQKQNFGPVVGNIGPDCSGPPSIPAAVVTAAGAVAQFFSGPFEWLGKVTGEISKKACSVEICTKFLYADADGTCHFVCPSGAEVTAEGFILEDGSISCPSGATRTIP